jgi:hypothetical protein
VTHSRVAIRIGIADSKLFKVILLILPIRLKMIITVIARVLLIIFDDLCQLLSSLSRYTSYS